MIKRKVIHNAYHKRIILSEKYGCSCYLCGRVYSDPQQLTLDHVYPLSKGGSNSIDNLMLACSRCNVLKGDAVATSITTTMNL